MNAATAPGAFALVRALWKRAPIWRFALMTALLTSLMFALFPPRREGATAPVATATATATATNHPATYIPRGPAAISRATPAAKVKAPPAAPNPRVTPRNATVTMATADKTIADNDTGLDPALLGRMYRGSVLIDGFNVPLPPGDWANLANSTITQATAVGDAHFLGKIRQKRLVGAIRIFAMRSKDLPGEGFNEAKSCTETNPGRTFVAIDDEMLPKGHQACWTIRSIYATPWSRWADRAVKIGPLDRAAAGDMTAKGVTYPQDFMSLTFTRTEQWGLLEVMYLFSPEAEGITSNTVLAVGEADWTPANIGKYPEKVAYVDKLKGWGIDFWPKFKAAFAAGQSP